MVTLLEWSTLEYHHTHKTPDWYWAVGIIAATGASLAFIFGNPVFAIFIILSAITLCIHVSKVPSEIQCAITNKGIVIHDTLFPYTSLDSFWVETLNTSIPKLILKSKKLLLPLVIVYIDEVDPEDVRKALLGYLKEEMHEEPFNQRIIEYLGL